MRREASSTESRVISNERPAASLKTGDAAAEEALEEPSDCRHHALLLSCAWREVAVGEAARNGERVAKV
jgi:hypothetical protein